MPYQFFDPERSKLDAWQNAKSVNFYSDDAHLQNALKYWLSGSLPDSLNDQLKKSGEQAAGVLNDYAAETNRDENLPVLRKFDGQGNKIEQISFHPWYHEMGKLMYGSGIMAQYENPGWEPYQLALFYLFAQNGESGHCCPLACTAGAIKLLQHSGTPEIKEHFLPKLYNPDYDKHFHGSQFLTELQGGSDVGQIKTEAKKDENGQWRIYGEKWFCSVIDAQIWVLAARPECAAEGTKGLMTFVAPRRLNDGTLNHFDIKRLKYKIGTRSMASAEIDLNGLLAFPVNEEGEGFKPVMDWVLNTSRYYNSFIAAAITKRAYREASSYAAHRQAFGHPIGQYPLIKRSLAYLKTEAALQLSCSMQVAFLAGKIAEGKADEHENKQFRFLVNAIKYWTSIKCTRAVHEAIEVLGGNGAIEEFSVLPRLYRDAIVVESWEGSHNVLCQQILRDMYKYKVHEPVFASDYHACRSVDYSLAEKYEEKLASLENQAGELLAMDNYEASLHIRSWLDDFISTHQGVAMMLEFGNCKDDNLREFYDGCLNYHYYRVLSNDRIFGNESLARYENEIGK